MFWQRSVDSGDLASLSHQLIKLESSSVRMSLQLLIFVEYYCVACPYLHDGVVLAVVDGVTLEVPYPWDNSTEAS